MNKERFKGLVMGFVICMMLSTSIAVLANTVTREITHGVRVNINGQLLQFDEDSQPFIMEGRTFLPVRAIADALELSADFDSATSTVYLVGGGQVAVASGVPVPVPPVAVPLPESTPQPQPPAPVETPVAAPGDATEPRIFTGSGDDVITLTPFPEPHVFVISGNEGGRHFAVHAHGDRRSLLVNTTSAYSGITFVSNHDTETLEVSAVGSWTIEQRALSEMRSVSTGQTISGTGDEVLQIASHGQTATVTGNSEGRHFAVHAHGSRRSLLVNTTSEYDGRVMLRGNYTVLEISAVGDWSIALE